MSLFPFMKNFLGVKGDQAAQGLAAAIVKMDPEGASLADLRVMEADLDKAGQAIAKLRAELAREQKEFDTVGKQYAELMSAAEILQKRVDDPATAEPQKASLKNSLAGLVEKLERMAPEIDRDKKDVAATQSLLAEAEKAYQDKAAALAEAKQTLERARHDMQHAALEEQRAKDKAEQAEVVAGLRQSRSSGLTVALNAMQQSAEQARQRAEASTMKAAALTHVSDAGNDKNVADALAQVRGTGSEKSLSDRLAALKR